LSAEPYLPAPPPPPASTEATAALILGIVGVLGGLGSCCCCFSLVFALCAPVAAFLGYRERIAIREGRSSQAGETMATVGMALGIVGSVLMVFYLVGMLVYVLLAGFSTVFEKMREGGSPFR
jgi:hypothetical protein